MTLPLPAKTAIADIETKAIQHDSGGRMIIPTHVHVLIAYDYERQIMHIWEGDDIVNGVRWLESCEMVVFHNGRGFDELVLEQVYDFDRTATKCLDSMILLQLFHSNVKEEDFRLFEEHAKRTDPDFAPYKFTGDLIGRHSLAAWGLRLRSPRPKGDYTEDMKAKGIEDPWEVYCDEMRDYAIQDVHVLSGIWAEKILPYLRHDQWNAINIEHYVAELMESLKNSGIKFDLPKALKLAEELELARETTSKVIEKEFPPRLEPSKWIFNELDGNNLTTLMMRFRKNKIFRPYYNLPEGYEREMWGEISYPKVKRTAKLKDGTVLYSVLPYEPVDDEPIGNNAFTKCEVVPFNPASRPQITRRLLEFGWEPEEFTEAGSPKVNEAELLKLEEDYPASASVVNYLLLEKRLGALKTGEKSWLACVSDDNFIHPTIRPCSTVTFRATHNDPNITQVPSVKMVKVLDEFGKVVQELKKDKLVDKMRPGLGLEGKWGWECRELFTTPDNFGMVGSDLAGIELRCLAHYLFPYDEGALLNVLLHEDIHENNRVILGFNDRRDAKAFLFGLIYGAGDEKLGHIIDKTWSAEKKKQEGKKARARFMAGITGMDHLDAQLQSGVKRGWLMGLDRRRIPVRKKHAALNSLLQSAGAIISKYWMYNAINIIEGEHNLTWGYDNDYTLMIYAHDELDFAVREGKQELVGDACLRAAQIAGTQLNMRVPIEAAALYGKNWAECH